MTIEVGLAVTILISLLGGMKWLSSSLATLSTKMDGVRERASEQHEAHEALVERVEEHGRDIAVLKSHQS